MQSVLPLRQIGEVLVQVVLRVLQEQRPQRVSETERCQILTGLLDIYH
jgi:hypothetical protein